VISTTNAFKVPLQKNFDSGASLSLQWIYTPPGKKEVLSRKQLSGFTI